MKRRKTDYENHKSRTQKECKEFDTKEEAEVDANDYLENGLTKFYEADAEKFSIEYYQAQY